MENYFFLNFFAFYITHCVSTEVARDNRDDNSLGVTPHIKPGDNLDELDSKVAYYQKHIPT